jgi:8-oxo-dGTP pyrophosphatase MutT (NUDIX family)
VSVPTDSLTADGLRRLAQTRLAAAPPVDAFSAPLSRRGDHTLNGLTVDPAFVAAARPAAVLAPIVPRPEGLMVLLTLRSAKLRSHSGQVAFPGGKIDAGETPQETALREAAEEVGLAPGLVEPLGWLDLYLTGTGYRVAPLVALIDPAFVAKPNPAEVAEAFETPFAFLMDAANHRLEERQWRGQMRKFYAMPHGERYIWGITAGILRNLYERLFT